MEKEDLNCPVCNAEFDSLTNLPRMIPGCNHTICSFCLEQLLEGISDSNKIFCPVTE